jgi:hypothetical protein
MLNIINFRSVENIRFVNYGVPEHLDDLGLIQLTELLHIQPNNCLFLNNNEVSDNKINLLCKQLNLNQ